MVQHHEQDPWTRIQTAHGLPADEVISSLQKEIRRGNLENAALLAGEMIVTSPDMEEYLWFRLQVISVEDVGYGNLNAPVLIDTLFRMHERIPRPHGDRYLMAFHAVRVLCESQKERGSDDLKNWVLHSLDHDIVPTIPDYALDMHTRRGQEMERDFLHFLTVAAKVEPEIPNRDRTYLDRLIEIAKSARDDSE
ncbi:MAG: AAA family ATPase [Anaerolineaceae bacterium]|nr:AAA family ATPase [Anaerolineaceae bacterium]